MNKKEFAKNIKTPEDLSSLTSLLTKQVIEVALGAEMDEHLGYEKTSKLTKLILEMVILQKHLKGHMVK